MNRKFFSRIAIFAVLVATFINFETQSATAATYTSSTITTNTDFYLTVTANTNITVTTSGSGDPTLWLFDSNNNQVAYNDDYSGLMSYISYTALNTGPYRLRAGRCCTYDGAFSGTSYTITINLTGSVSTSSSDVTAPTISSLSIALNAGADNRYKAGDVITLNIVWSENVNITGSPRVPIQGLSAKYFVYSSGSGTNTTSLTYTVVSGDNDSDGISISANTLELNGGTIKDASNNVATLTHVAVSASLNQLIDTTAPTIISALAPVDGTYKPLDTPTFTVAFSESVTVTGTPRLTLTVGAITKYANYVSQTDNRTALFRYTVTSSTSEFDMDGISISNSIDLNGGSILDLASNALTTLTFSPPNTSGIKVAQPPAPPTISSFIAGSAFVNVIFTAGATYGSEITNYQFSTNNGSSWTSRSPTDISSPLTISGLNNGTSYQIRIRAVSAVGTSDSSTAITATPTAVTVAGGTNISTTYGVPASSSPFTTSGGVSSYTYTLSSNIPGISISNGVVTTSSTLNAGTYSLNVISTDSYLATGSKAITITVAKARQDTLTITSSAGVFNGNPSSLFLLTTGGSDTGTVTFSNAGGGTASGCTFSGSTLQVTSAGTCKIVATKAATTNFLIAYSETATITFAQYIYNQPVQTQSVPTQLPINGQNSLDVTQTITVPAVTGVFLVNSTYEINGTGFTGVNRVVIGGSEATIISSTSTKIVIDSAGLMPGPLFIECADGRIGPSPFYFFAP
jgi:hypothetical protein